jgi:hypothetical protein
LIMNYFNINKFIIMFMFINFVHYSSMNNMCLQSVRFINSTILNCSFNSAFTHYSDIIFHSTLYYISLHDIAWHCMTLHCIAFHCIALHSSEWDNSALHYIISYHLSRYWFICR